MKQGAKRQHERHIGSKKSSILREKKPKIIPKSPSFDNVDNDTSFLQKRFFNSKGQPHTIPVNYSGGINHHGDLSTPLLDHDRM
jgi:hypothetical protein